MTYQQVIQHFGGDTEAAAALGLSRQAINLWKEAGIPRSRQLHIEAVTRKKLKADPAAKAAA